MNKHDILRQLTIVSAMLEGVCADEIMRPDLPMIAAKLRLLTRLIPKVIDAPGEASDLLADVRRLRRRWGELFFGDKEPNGQKRDDRSRACSGGSAVRRGPWTIAEEKQFVDEVLDDTALRLFAIFGRVRPNAKVSGQWRVRIGECSYDAASLREMFNMMVPPEPTADEWLWAIAADAVLLWAGNGIRLDQLAELAEVIGPAVHELFVSEEPMAVMERVVTRLMADGMLHDGPPSHRPSRSGQTGVYQLTSKGFERARGSFNTWWQFTDRSTSADTPCRPQDQRPDSADLRDDDIPF